MTESDSVVAERIRGRVEAELQLLPEHLRAWLIAHRVTPTAFDASLDPDGSERIRVFLVTGHTGVKDSSSRIVYEPKAGGFGIAIDLKDGVSWFQGAVGSLVAAVESM